MNTSEKIAGGRALGPARAKVNSSPRTCPNRSSFAAPTKSSFRRLTKSGPWGFSAASWRLARPCSNVVITRSGRGFCGDEESAFSLFLTPPRGTAAGVPDTRRFCVYWGGRNSWLRAWVFAPRLPAAFAFAFSGAPLFRRVGSCSSGRPDAVCRESAGRTMNTCIMTAPGEEGVFLNFNFKISAGQKHK